MVVPFLRAISDLSLRCAAALVMCFVHPFSTMRESNSRRVGSRSEEASGSLMLSHHSDSSRFVERVATDISGSTTLMLLLGRQRQLLHRDLSVCRHP